MTGERLFPLQPTDRERRQRRDANQRAQVELFDVQAASAPTPCPACAGIGDACTCHQTGAEALELEPWPGFNEGACSECHAPWPDCTCDICAEEGCETAPTSCTRCGFSCTCGQLAAAIRAHDLECPRCRPFANYLASL